MNLQVISKQLEYNLEFFGKYSIIQGDSGNGKTNLCRLLRDRQIGDKTIKIMCSIPVFTIDALSDGSELSKITDSLVVIDEYYQVLKESNVADILQGSNNYFLIISRKCFDFLPVCVESIYDMKTSGKRHWIEPKFRVSGNNQVTKRMGLF